MSDKKPESWESSFDHVVLGARAGAWRLQADREAKFENKYGRKRPHEQQLQHQGGAGALGPGEDRTTDSEDSAPLELAEEDASPQREEHDNVVELLHDVAQELENQQQLDQQQQDLELPNDNDQQSDEGGSSGTRTPPGSPPLASSPRVESDGEDVQAQRSGSPSSRGRRQTSATRPGTGSPASRPTLPRSPSAPLSGRGDVVSFVGRWCPTRFPTDRIRPARHHGSRKSWRMTGRAAGCSHLSSTSATSLKRGGLPGHRWRKP